VQESQIEKPLTKTELVNYLGPVIQDLKSELSTKSEMRSLERRLTDKINWQGTLMEEMNKKIDLALELSETTTSNDIAIKEHSSRIMNLENDVKVVKLALKTPKN
jgi:YesN/AraC family two-component response regulator